MSISAAEIGQIIKRKIADFDAPVVSAESGVITTLGDGIAQIYGLQGAMEGELLAFPNDIMGLALNLEEDQVRAIIPGAAPMRSSERGMRSGPPAGWSRSRWGASWSGG